MEHAWKMRRAWWKTHVFWQEWDEKKQLEQFWHLNRTQWRNIELINRNLLKWWLQVCLRWQWNLLKKTWLKSSKLRVGGGGKRSKRTHTHIYNMYIYMIIYDSANQSARPGTYGNPEQKGRPGGVPIKKVGNVEIQIRSINRTTIYICLYIYIYIYVFLNIYIYLFIVIFIKYIIIYIINIWDQPSVSPTVSPFHHSPSDKPSFRWQTGINRP